MAVNIEVSGDARCIGTFAVYLWHSTISNACQPPDIPPHGDRRIWAGPSLMRMKRRRALRCHGERGQRARRRTRLTIRAAATHRRVPTGVHASSSQATSRTCARCSGRPFRSTASMRTPSPTAPSRAVKRTPCWHPDHSDNDRRLTITFTCEMRRGLALYRYCAGSAVAHAQVLGTRSHRRRERGSRTSHDCARRQRVQAARASIAAYGQRRAAPLRNELARTSGSWSTTYRDRCAGALPVVRCNLASVILEARESRSPAGGARISRSRLRSVHHRGPEGVSSPTLACDAGDRPGRTDPGRRRNDRDRP